MTEGGSMKTIIIILALLLAGTAWGGGFTVLTQDYYMSCPEGYENGAKCIKLTRAEYDRLTADRKCHWEYFYFEIAADRSRPKGAGNVPFIFDINTPLNKKLLEYNAVLHSFKYHKNAYEWEWAEVIMKRKICE